MKVAIIDYNAGNVKSVFFALNRLGVHHILTDNTEEIRSADKVIFPGVGEAASTMSHLKQKGLDKLIPDLKQPVLGICLGMQLMCEFSEERNAECLGIFPLKVRLFQPEIAINTDKLKVPHMGWNNIYDLKGKLFDTCIQDSFVYFVHSYYVESSEYTIATANYVLPFSAALNKNNFYATQFHPEKSGTLGETILKNFITKV